MRITQRVPDCRLLKFESRKSTIENCARIPSRGITRGPIRMGCSNCDCRLRIGKSDIRNRQSKMGLGEPTDAPAARGRLGAQPTGII